MLKNSLFYQLRSLIVPPLACLCVSATASSVTVSFDTNSAPLVFAAAEIGAASAAAKDLPKLAVSLKVDATALKPQGYRSEFAGDKLTVTGGDAVGAMSNDQMFSMLVPPPPDKSAKYNDRVPFAAESLKFTKLPAGLYEPLNTDAPVSL